MKKKAPTLRTARSAAASPGLRRRGLPSSSPSSTSGSRSASIRRILSLSRPRALSDWAASLRHLFQRKNDDEEVEEEWMSYRGPLVRGAPFPLSRPLPSSTHIVSVFRASATPSYKLSRYSKMSLDNACSLASIRPTLPALSFSFNWRPISMRYSLLALQVNPPKEMSCEPPFTRSPTQWFFL